MQVYGFLEFFSGKAETSFACLQTGEATASFDKKYKPKKISNYFDILSAVGFSLSYFADESCYYHGRDTVSLHT
jgi:hypothetical protein